MAASNIQECVCTPEKVNVYGTKRVSKKNVDFIFRTSYCLLAASKSTNRLLQQLLLTDTKYGPAKSLMTPVEVQIPMWPMNGKSHLRTETESVGIHTHT